MTEEPGVDQGSTAYGSAEAAMTLGMEAESLAHQELQVADPKGMVRRCWEVGHLDTQKNHPLFRSSSELLQESCQTHQACRISVVDTLGAAPPAVHPFLAHSHTVLYLAVGTVRQIVPWMFREVLRSRVAL